MFRSSAVIFYIAPSFIHYFFITVNTVKSDWKKIRDCHRDAIKRRRLLRNERDPQSVKKWKFEDQMEFLLKFMTNRKREPYNNNNDNTVSDNEDTTLNEQVINETLSLANEDFSGTVSTQKATPNSAQKSSHVFKQEDSKLSGEAMDLFFNAMCATTKKLPTKYQMRIKKEVFEVVTRYEEAAFQCDDEASS